MLRGKSDFQQRNGRKRYCRKFNLCKYYAPLCIKILVLKKLNYLLSCLVVLPCTIAWSVEVAFVRDGDLPAELLKIESIKREWRVLQGQDDGLRWREDAAFRGEVTAASVRGALVAALEDQDVAVVVTTGALGMYAAMQGDLPGDKPVIIAELDKADFRILAADVESTRLVLTEMPGALRGELVAFYELVGFDRVTLLVERRLLGENSEAVEWLKEFGKGLPFSVGFFPADGVEATLASLASARPQALVITRYLPYSPEQRERLVEGINALAVPSFSSFRREDVELGVLAAMMPDVEERLARRVAVNLLRVLRGEEPRSISGILAVGSRLAVNVKTAERVGVDLPLRVFLDAELFEREGIALGQKVELNGAMELARRGNIEAAVSRARVLAALAQSDVVRGALLPQVDAGISSSFQSDNTARLSGRPERITRAGIEVRQIIFNDRVMQSYLGAVDARRARQLEHEALLLDLTAAGGAAYIDYLASRALLVVDTENLRLTRSNLEVARSRVDAGEGEPSEVLRWESEEARGRSLVQQREASAAQARVRFNQILGLPMSTRWDPQDIVLRDRDMGFLDNQLLAVVSSIRQLRRFGVYSVLKALESEPSLRAVDELVRLGERDLGVERRSFILPEVAARFNYDHELESEYGAPLRRPAGLERGAWSAVLQARLPLFEGGSRVAAVRQRGAELEAVVAQREAAAQRVERRVLESLYALEGSWPSIELSRKAEAAALRNLDLVRDQYAEGSVGLVELVDAQRQYLEARRASVVAVYSYMGDLIEYQRAISWFEFEHDEAERVMWVEDMLRVTGGLQEK